MNITYLGHAGFCVETEGAVIVADPWLSPTGAFDASWFQLPRNHHLAEFVDEQLDSPKEKFVYVSHEHEDHFDRAFLDSLRNRDFTLVLAKYRRPHLRRVLGDYRCKGLVALTDRQTLSFTGGELKLFIDDSELNRDSALLVRAEGQTFLNLNDCRIFDRVREIAESEGAIDVFTCQFSGASWHPTCYEYSPEEFHRIAEHKVMSKFKMVERAIDVLKPRYFLPSAGPVCFLAPELLDLNFNLGGIFRRSPEVLNYLRPVMERAHTLPCNLQPGDAFDVADGHVALHSGERYDDGRFAEYVAEYAAGYRAFFDERDRQNRAVDAGQTLSRLRTELQAKLDLLTLRERVTVPLYYGLEELPGRWLRVDFSGGTVDETDVIAESSYYRITCFAWQVAKVLDENLSWEDFGLSFRVRLKRVPDSYQALIHAFLTLDKGDLYRFCQMTIDLESRTDRIEVTAGGKTYAVNRYCPHNGGDLLEGWTEDERYLVCARHRWCFDLTAGGKCTTNETSIWAEELSVAKT